MADDGKKRKFSEAEKEYWRKRMEEIRAKSGKDKKKPKPHEIGCGCLVLLLIAVAVPWLIFANVCGDSPKEPPTQLEKKKQENQAVADRCLSPWDGSFEPLSNWIKNNYLRFPDTWEHQETTLFAYGSSGYRVRTNFQAKNAFGVPIPHTALADMDDQCNLIDVTEIRER